MSLLSGDLTTPYRVATWLSTAPALPSAILSQLVTSQSRVINSKLNRGTLYSALRVRTFDGVGYPSLVLPDYPVTNIVRIQQGAALIPAAQLQAPPTTSSCYGYRYIPWAGDLPGAPAVVEFDGGTFYPAPQNVKVTYTAGYLVSGEAQTVPSSSPYIVNVSQPLGIWCRDNGVVYASTGVTLVPVASNPAQGQYVVGPDSNPGQYSFAAADAGSAILVSYSFIPADLEEAVIQMVAERYSYRSRVGDLSKSLGGQETVRFMRGGGGPPWGKTSSLPPEVMDMITPYISVLLPQLGSPL